MPGSTADGPSAAPAMARVAEEFAATDTSTVLAAFGLATVQKMADALSAQCLLQARACDDVEHELQGRLELEANIERRLQQARNELASAEAELAAFVAGRDAADVAERIAVLVERIEGGMKTVNEGDAGLAILKRESSRTVDRLQGLIVETLSQAEMAARFRAVAEAGARDAAPGDEASASYPQEACATELLDCLEKARSAMGAGGTTAA